MTNRSEYMAWHAMHRRCILPQHRQYPNYGGRGIKVDPQWNSFKQFFEDMGPKPGSEYTLERLDNNDNYCKENCCWATYKEQANNRRVRRDRKYIIVKGKSATIAEWARELGISDRKLRHRLISHGELRTNFEEIVAKLKEEKDAHS